MTRKAKIGWVVGGIALGAICFFSSEEEGEMGISYAGLASNDSRYVSFTISNSFDHEMYCDYETFELVDGHWQWCRDGLCRELGFISTGCATNLTLSVPGTNQWQMIVSFTKARPDNFISDARDNLMRFAFEHGWSALEKLSKIGYTWHLSYGPEMLGHKPLAETPERRELRQ